MSDRPFMPFYSGDFHRKTKGLTFEERSAYFWLLDALWISGGSIPDHDADNARWLGLSLRRWRSIKPRLMPFLTILPNGNLSQDRVTFELQSVEAKRRKMRENGSRGGRPRKNENKYLAKPKGFDLDNQTESIARATPESESYPEESPNMGTDVGDYSPAKSESHVRSARAKKADRGTRLPDDWEPGADEIRIATERGFPIDQTRAIGRAFRNYWTSLPGAKGRKINWTRTFENWLDKERPARSPANGARPPASPWRTRWDEARAKKPDAHHLDVFSTAELNSMPREDRDYIMRSAKVVGF